MTPSFSIQAKVALPSSKSFKNCLSSLHCCFTADGAGSREQIYSLVLPLNFIISTLCCVCGQIQAFPNSAVPPAAISVSPSSLLPMCHGTAYLPSRATCHTAPNHSKNHIFFLRSFLVCFCQVAQRAKVPVSWKLSAKQKNIP